MCMGSAVQDSLFGRIEEELLGYDEEGCREGFKYVLACCRDR